MTKKATHSQAPPPSPLAALADEALVEQTLAGNRRAFEVLVRRHERGLVNYLYRLTRLRDGALDLAQDVFIKVYVSLSSFNPRYRFTTWLYRIASNCAIDHLRRKQPRVYSTGDVGPEPAVSLDAPQGAGPSPHEVLRLRELEGRLEEAIASLPVGYRQLILLRHRQHCRYDEIARITRLPIGTVKNRIFRAREMLRKRLSDVIDGGA